MTRQLRLSLLLGLLVALASPAVPAIASGRADRPDPAAAARHRLSDDASGRIVLDRDAAGRVRFVGTAAHASIDNPTVRPDTTVAAAARAHLDRYGASLDAAPGSTLERRSQTRTTAGVDVVAYGQEVSGVPVLGGEVLVGVGPDRQLRSLVSSVAPSVEVTDGTVSTAAAERTALGVVSRTAGHARLDVTDLGRWVVDPQVSGLSLPVVARTVHRLEVADGAGVRRMVLVDDHTGAVVANVDLIEAADRVVCDRNDAPGAQTPCTSGFARTEGDPALTEPDGKDANDAYDLSGAVSDFYGEIDPGIDLTAMLGVDVSGTKKLASTVRFCTSNGGDPCPYPNAFWDGTGMFYGNGYAGADDVVGHEMTHGVVDQYSKLFYWGQSGAINESMADVMGEIIDHRHPSSGDTATDWRLGEDLPIGAIRSMSNPPAYDQPDSTGSALYEPDPTYADNGGVHTNSGVGNKTAYLISQGGTFNGQTITGIDAGDPSLTRTATLYLDVIRSLPSGADYAVLGRVLDQSCADLQAVGELSAANCTAVHRAGIATQLATAPAKAHPATDAPTACPTGTTKRVLLDSETDPAAQFAPVASGWVRQSTAGWSNATSGTDSWYAEDPGGDTVSGAWIQTNPLRSTSSIALPAGQYSYLSFANWYLLDFDPNGYYDGGTVELGVDGGVPTLGSTNDGTWVNGPGATLASGYGNTGAGHPAYSGDSRGWSVSRLDLTAYAGHTVRPQFTMRSDNQYAYLGWYLDDITIYTCDPGPPPGAPASARGVGGVGTAQLSWSAPSVNAASVTGYRITASNGAIVRTGAGARTATVTGLGSTGYGFEVRATGAYGYLSAPFRVTLAGTAASLKAKRSGGTVKLRGVLTRSGAAFAGRTVVLERKSGGAWVRVAVVQTTSSGAFARKVKRRTAATYRARFVGGAGVMGSVSPQRRK